MEIKFEKVLETYVTYADGTKTDTRFIRLESPDADYKVQSAKYKTGYIDVKACAAVDSIVCGGTTFRVPQMLIRENCDGTPKCAEVSIYGQSATSADFDDFLDFVARLRKNVEAIDDVIRKINAGEISFGDGAK